MCTLISKWVFAKLSSFISRKLRSRGELMCPMPPSSSHWGLTAAPWALGGLISSLSGSPPQVSLFWGTRLPPLGSEGTKNKMCLKQQAQGMSSEAQNQSETCSSINPFFFLLLCCPQTPLPTLGIALKFHNYSITKKSVKGCDHGWWEINEHM